MSTATIETAKVSLDALIQQARSGEDVYITDHDLPLVQLVPILSPEERQQQFLKHIRALRGSLKGAPDFEREEDREVW